MTTNLKLARVYFVLLALFVVLRFAVGNVAGVPYEKFTDKISIVILTLVSALLYAAFARAFLGYKIVDAAKLAMTLGLASQVAILLATALSYAGRHSVRLQQPPGPQPAGSGLRALRGGDGHPRGRRRGEHAGHGDRGRHRLGPRGPAALAEVLTALFRLCYFQPRSSCRCSGVPVKPPTVGGLRAWARR